MSSPPRDPRSIHVETPSAESSEANVHGAVEPPGRRRWPWVLLGLALVVGLPLGIIGFSAWSAWRGVERVELADVLHGSATGTNYLVVGTDSREGVDPDIEDAGAILGGDVSGARTDTIAVLRVEGDAVSLLAIPRDLYVPLATGSTNRINAAFAFGGPEALVATVQAQLGIGINHYLEIDLAGFLGLVDALGGVTIEFPHPAYDDRSGLAIDAAGPVELDGAQALAYVRSRRYTERIDGVLVTDPTSDLGRVQRQQRFLAAVMSELGATRNPFTLIGAMGAVGDHVAVDEGLGLLEAARLGLTLRGAQPLSSTVPTDRFITPTGADVLVLNSESDAVLAAFRG